MKTLIYLRNIIGGITLIIFLLRLFFVSYIINYWIISSYLQAICLGGIFIIEIIIWYLKKIK